MPCKSSFNLLLLLIFLTPHTFIITISACTPITISDTLMHPHRYTYPTFQHHANYYETKLFNTFTYVSHPCSFCRIQWELKYVVGMGWILQHRRTKYIEFLSTPATHLSCAWHCFHLRTIHCSVFENKVKSHLSVSLLEKINSLFPVYCYSLGLIEGHSPTC